MQIMLDSKGRIMQSCFPFPDICTDTTLVNYHIYIFQPAITSHKIILNLYSSFNPEGSHHTHRHTGTEPHRTRKLNKYLTTPNKIIQCFRTFGPAEERHCDPVVGTQTKEWEIFSTLLMALTHSLTLNQPFESLTTLGIPFSLFTKEAFLGPKTRKDYKRSFGCVYCCQSRHIPTYSRTGNFCWKRQENKCFRIWRSYRVCCNYSTLPF